MSEHQYYEFQAVDKVLSEQQKKEISQLSSRVQLTSRKAIFIYNYSDFRGRPEEVLEKYFDAMFYIANWGTIQLMLKFPKSLVNLQDLEKYCDGENVRIILNLKSAILNIEFDNEEGFGWIEDDGYLDSLINIRKEILEQDYRVLYLAWLRIIEEQDLEYSEIEPPIPPGLNKLSSALNSFVELFEIDEHLLKVAAKNSQNKTNLSQQQIEKAIGQIPRPECNKMLLKLSQGDLSVEAELHQRILQIVDNSPSLISGQRTSQHLFELAQSERIKEQQALQKQAEARRINRLEALASQENQVWQNIEELISKKQSKPYDEAVKLLSQLHDLAIYQDKESFFQDKINDLYQRYSRRPGLLNRLKKRGLNRK
ncbi:hypothetical protein [Crocosphaera chwakensis]|uniref:Uncharacterized protein n=1 Tax=Crocosphaera chwakensis CCY0110 TaxID=391612 RepID=A3IWT6_9CHRO|nr:hypothetical protein [Crocosphaera chwakensis]EAZ89038.1 hypothetical protein CY0110_01305 [Crocosphaera chwakensis CCY0110]